MRWRWYGGVSGGFRRTTFHPAVTRAAAGVNNWAGCKEGQIVSWSRENRLIRRLCWTRKSAVNLRVVTERLRSAASEKAGFGKRIGGARVKKMACWIYDAGSDVHDAPGLEIAGWLFFAHAEARFRERSGTQPGRSLFRESETVPVRTRSHRIPPKSTWAEFLIRVEFSWLSGLLQLKQLFYATFGLQAILIFNNSHLPGSFQNGDHGTGRGRLQWHQLYT